MTDITLRPIALADRSVLAALQSEVFDDYERSELLAKVLDAEAMLRPNAEPPELPDEFGVAAFQGDSLVGWSRGHRQGTREFYMLNSGVAHAHRRTGIYTAMVKAILTHAKEQGYQRVTSRHAAANNSVLIAKLKLGFRVSGFEYSEVYGPLVQLTYLVNEARDRLYRVRAASIRTPR
jgi:ribosomal protein S18 acetylase RimI-like enzyme